ncbi:hypothetical protein R6V09_06685 [Streptomyces sp. W16]|uniref:hypothetical protein n=1 Tax=Streptomyces sp. W16 TaxID=3076631 RepID=UPI00295C2E86|nr:hypothetical protein [Streptomyces sp. W16]MDV9169822.1 hypothetical protein [Streptomyces sp. W16]
MSTIDDLLAQSLLLHQPRVPSDVVPYDDLAYEDLAADGFLLWDAGPKTADDGAAQSLAALCEAVVTHCTIEQLADFLTDQVPEPRSAWILGCALQLAGADDGARFWWQFAAGADDQPASYCLYLQHLAQGDTHAAALWRAQAGPHAPHDGDDTDPADSTDPGQDAPAYRMMTADTSLSTVLRILSHLTRANPRQHTPMAQAVIDIVAAAVAVGYDHHPDLELPVPGDDFAERLAIAAIAASGTGQYTRPTDTPAAAAGDAEDLPNRPPLHPDSDDERVPAWTRGPEQMLVNVTADGHEEPAITHTFFRAASAVCSWEAATASNGTDGRGTPMSYHLSRLRTRAAKALSQAPSGFGKGFAAPAASGSSSLPTFHRL